MSCLPVTAEIKTSTPWYRKYKTLASLPWSANSSPRQTAAQVRWAARRIFMQGLLKVGLWTPWGMECVAVVA